MVKICRWTMRIPVSACISALLLAAVGGAYGDVASDNAAPTVELRRALLASAAAGDQAAVPKLLDALNSDDREVRLTAVHLLMRHPATSTEVISTALAIPNADVRRVVLDCLAATDRMDPFLKLLMYDPDRWIALRLRLQVVPSKYVGEDGTLSDHFIDLVEPVFRGAPDEVRQRIAEIVTDYPATDRGRAILELAVDDPRPEVVALAAGAMVKDIAALNRARDSKNAIGRYSKTDTSRWPDEQAYGLHYELGFAYYRLRDAENARLELDIAIGHRPDRRALLWAARNHRDHLGDPGKAIEYYLRAIDTRHGVTGSLLRDARIECALTLSKLGRYTEALEVIAPALKDYPSGISADLSRLAYADVLNASGNTAAAAAEYRNLLQSTHLANSIKERIQRELDRLEK